MVGKSANVAGQMGPSSVAAWEVQSAINRIESLIAQLVFVTGFRDPNSGIYHFTSGLKDPAPAEIDHFLRSLHEDAFVKWLNFRLEEQRADLELYFSNLPCGKVVAIQTWLNLESYRQLMPASADPIERQLFLSDLEVLLRLMADSLAGSLTGLENPVPPRKLLTVQELSDYLGISCRSLCLWAERQKIPAMKAGRRWRFHPADIAEWIRAHKSRGKKPDCFGLSEEHESASQLKTELPTSSGTPCAIGCSGAGIFALTARERDTLDLIASGRTNKEISASLSISENTVREHRKHICAKLSLHSSAELVACAVCRLAGTCRQATPSDEGGQR